MLKIGEFAWLSQVTVRTLRYYDEIGLLKPLHVDPFTDYRYYALDQLPRLNRILALKDLGLSLEQIARMLDEDLSPDQVRGMLRFKQAELQDQMQEVRTRLARVEARLTQIEMEGKMPEYDVLLKTVEAQRIASARETLPSWGQDVVGPTLSRMFHEVGKHLADHGVDYAGSGIAIWHGSHGGMGEAVPDVEAAAPIDQPVPESDRITVREVPRAQVAYVVHHGDYGGLFVAREAIFAWMERNGYRLTAPVREVYLYHDPGHKSDEDSPNHVTEVQFPVEKV